MLSLVPLPLGPAVLDSRICGPMMLPGVLPLDSPDVLVVDPLDGALSLILGVRWEVSHEVVDCEAVPG